MTYRHQLVAVAGLHQKGTFDCADLIIAFAPNQAGFGLARPGRERQEVVPFATVQAHAAIAACAPQRIRAAPAEPLAARARVA